MLRWFKRLITAFFVLLGWFGVYKAFGQTGAIFFPAVVYIFYRFIFGEPEPKPTTHECHWCYKTMPPGQGFEHTKGRWYCNDTCLINEREAHREGDGKE